MTFAPGTSPLVHPQSGATQSGEQCGRSLASVRRGELAALDPFLYQEMRWCETRGEMQPFVAMYECEGGRLELCLGCGEERVVRFTRTTQTTIGDAA